MSPFCSCWETFAVQFVLKQRPPPQAAGGTASASFLRRTGSNEFARCRNSCDVVVLLSFDQQRPSFSLPPQAFKVRRRKSDEIK